MANTTDYNFDLCKEICQRLIDEDFSNVSQILVTNVKYPARSTFFKWKRENKELSDLYTIIQQDKGELFVEEIDQVWQDLKNGLIDAPSARVLIDTLKWKAAKYYPKMYGDKIDVTSKDEKINSVTEVIFKRIDANGDITS